MLSTYSAQNPYLSAIIWLTITIGVYLISLVIFRLLGRRPVFHPMIFCIALLTIVLFYAGVGVTAYQAHTNVLTRLLGPATVALAVPLYTQLSSIRQNTLAIMLPILIGGTIAPILALAGLYFVVLDKHVRLSLLTKSITSPLAIETSQHIGGIPGLAVVIVIFTGIVGAIFASVVYRIFKITSAPAQGLALGTVGHAIGTAQGFQMSQKIGAFATLGLCINGVLTAIILPIIFFLIS